MTKYFIYICFSLNIVGCSVYLAKPLNTELLPSKPFISVSDYGTLSSGESIKKYQLIAEKIRLSAINYGGIITHIEVPDRYGKWHDVVLGYDNLADYEHKNRFFGALVGRYANRIEHGSANILGETVQLSTNRPPHQLHGGFKGFDKQVWQAETEQRVDSVVLHLRHTSPDGYEGYPGELQVQVSYIVTNAGELLVEYRASTNKNTIFNPTQHSYFNLSGKPNVDVLDHQLTLNAQTFIELNNESLPTGRVLAVKGTPFDFLQSKAIGRDIGVSHKQLAIARGYDHYFITQKKRGELAEVAQLYHPDSGRLLRVSSTEKGAQLYSANYLNNSVIGKKGNVSMPQQGICIETGQLPNAPAQEVFDSYILTPENPFYSLTQFAFSTKQ